jgi:hypothetical protein
MASPSPWLTITDQAWLVATNNLYVVSLKYLWRTNTFDNLDRVLYFLDLDHIPERQEPEREVGAQRGKKKERGGPSSEG